MSHGAATAPSKFQEIEGATTSASTIPPRGFDVSASIASTANSPRATPGRPRPPRREIVSHPQIIALIRVADVVSIFRPGGGDVAKRGSPGKRRENRGLWPSLRNLSEASNIQRKSRSRLDEGFPVSVSYRCLSLLGAREGQFDKPAMAAQPCVFARMGCLFVRRPV